MSGKSTISLRDRFDRRVGRSAAPDGCWTWLASRSRAGYGYFRVNGRTRNAHRVAYELANGEIPDGMVVRHDCDNPACVNPSHLRLGTMKDNTADMMSRGRDDHGVTRGEDNAKHVLRNIDVSIMRYLRECGVKLAHLAPLFGVSQARVSQICRGSGWSHVPRLEYP